MSFGMEVTHDIAQEMAGVDLADPRRTQRAVALVQRLAKRPQGTLLSAMQGRAELAAAYRFLHNEAVTASALLQAHIEAGLCRLHGRERVLCLVDSCFISYSHRGAVEGLGPPVAPHRQRLLRASDPRREHPRAGPRHAALAQLGTRAQKRQTHPRSCRQCRVGPGKQPAPGEEPVRWILLTNLPVDTLEQAVEKVRWYQLRWRIEMFFDALKNICRIEEA